MPKRGIRVSLCMIALNEQDLIARCLRSARSVVDEIVVGIDSRTTDRTAEIARRFGARVLPIDWHDDFSRARNLTIEAATGQWILILDADDQLLPAGAKLAELVRARDTELAAHSVAGFMFEIAERRLDNTLDRIWLAPPRLFRRTVRYRRRLHEEPGIPPAWGAVTWAVPDEGPQIEHVGYDPSLYRVRAKAERNQRLAELQVADDPTDPTSNFELMRALLSAGRFDEARAQALTTLAIDGLPEAGRVRINALLNTGSDSVVEDLSRSVLGSSVARIDRMVQVRAAFGYEQKSIPILELGGV